MGYIARFLIGPALLAIWVAVDRCAAAPARFDVGLGKVDITPQEPVVLAGYGSRTGPSEGIETRLWARALAIGLEHPHVVIAVDNCGVPKSIVEAVHTELARRHSIDRSALVICSTHTHNAPALPGYAPILWQERIGPQESEVTKRYAKELTGKLVEVANQALAQRSPATLHWGMGTVSFGGNRRVIDLGRWQGFGFQHDAPVDHSLPILVVKNSSDEVVGIWTNYACHCTTLGSVNTVGGDWAGFANEAIEQIYPRSIALTTIGCGADVGPQPTGSTSIAKQHGAAIAEEVRRVVSVRNRSSSDFASELSEEISSNETTINLPLENVFDREHWAERTGLRSFDGVHAREMLRRLSEDGKIDRHVEYRISTWHFDDQLAIVFLPGEVCVDYAIRLKSENDWKRIWIHGWSNDVPCYIPSRRVLREGGYEADFSMVYYGLPSRLKASVEQQIVSATNDLLPGAIRRPAGEKKRPDFFRHPDSANVGMLAIKKSIAKLDESQQRLYDAIERIAEDAVAGFQRVEHQDFEDAAWFDFYGRRGPKRPFVRQLKVGDRLDWSTPALTRSEGKRVVLCFSGGLGWRSQPGTDGFELQVGDAHVRFDVTDSISRWVDESKDLELYYLPTWRSDEDTAGFFLLIVDPQLIDDGQAILISVTSLGSGSNRWFAIDKANNSPDWLAELLNELD